VTKQERKTRLLPGTMYADLSSRRRPDSRQADVLVPLRHASRLRPSFDTMELNPNEEWGVVYYSSIFLSSPFCSLARLLACASNLSSRG
jgi:hypothetical protein